MNDKLKPCPFCGSEARIEEIRTFAGIAYSVSCMDIDMTCPMYYLKTRYFGTKKQATEAWNRRVNGKGDFWHYPKSVRRKKRKSKSLLWCRRECRC